MNYIFYSVYQFIVQAINIFGCPTLLFTLKHGSPIFYGKGPHPYGGLFRGPHVGKNSNLLNELKCRVVSIVYTQFTNVAADRWVETYVLMCVILRHVSPAVYM